MSAAIQYADQIPQQTLCQSCGKHEPDTIIIDGIRFCMFCAVMYLESIQHEADLCAE